MRIDCSKTLNYGAELDRMCDANTSEGRCKTGCGLYKLTCWRAKEITQEHIDIVQKWSDEHPQETMAEHFLKMLPNAKISSDGTPVICPHYIGWGNQGRCPKADGKFGSCTECWNRPYREAGADNGKG